MLLSFATVSVSAETVEDIMQVYATNVPVAEIGQTATAEGIVVADDEPYTLTSAEWLDCTESEPQPVTGEFEEKRIYILQLIFTAKEGYEFSDEYVNITFDEENVYPYYNIIDGDLIVDVEYSFLEYIDKVEITGVVDAAIGNNPEVEGIKVPDEANYEIELAVWHEINDDEPIYDEYIFQDGKKYELTVVVQPKSGYRFRAFETDCFVNGEKIKRIEMQTEETIIISLSYSFLKQINEVEIPDVPDYAVGDKIILPVFERSEGINYDVEYFWYLADPDEGYISISDEDEKVFEDGKVYNLEIDFIPDDGYGFSEDVEIIVGDNVAEPDVNEELFMYYDVMYYFGYETIDRVDLTAKLPEIGADIDYEAISTPEDAHYTLMWADYYENSEDDYYNSDYAEDKFLKDNYYWLDVEFDLDEGYCVTDDTDLYINGEKVLTFEDGFSKYPEYTSCSVRFGKLVEIKDSSEIFSDVVKGAWYQEYVDYVSSHNLMNGVGGDKFGTTDTVTRATVVTVLARMSGIDTNAIMNTQTPFTDAPAGKWYSGAVAWAVENGITKGASATTFEPDKAVTREDICTFIYRYADFAGIEFEKKVEKSVFSDESTMGSWAKDAIYACQQAEIVNGKPGGIFDAKGKAGRSEIAKILAIFHDDYIN